MSFTNKELKELSILAILALVSYLSYSGYMTYILDILYYEYISHTNSIYLQSSLTELEDTLSTLSQIKALFAVIQSSSGGISFFIDVEVRLGEILNVISELFSKAWYVTFVSIFAIKLWIFITDISRDIMPILLNIAIVLITISYLSRYNYPRLHITTLKLSMINLFVILLSYVVIPFFIYFTSTISHQYLKESKQQRDIELKSIHTKLTNQNSSSLHTDVESSINILKDKKDSLQKEHSFYSKLTIEHTFAHLLEFFIIPIFMIIFLMYICGRLLKDLVILLKKE
jgi:hypothetical protein